MTFARRVREPVRFAWRHATTRSTVGRYRLRGSDLVIFLRHGTGDIATFDEVIQRRYYLPPDPVSRALDGVGRPLAVADLGANIGLFAVDLLRHRRVSRIVAVEPDPANLELLRLTAGANAGTADWSIVEACAAPSDGTVPFLAGGFATSRVAPEGTPGAAPMRAFDVFPVLEGIDYVKIDIEGSEWALLDDPRLGSLDAVALVMEYHPEGCSDPDPRDAARTRLEAAGFEVTDAAVDAPPGYGTLWAWR